MSLITRALPRPESADEPTDQHRQPLRSPVLVGLLAATQAAVAGLLFVVVPVMVGWMSAARVSVGWPEAVRVASDIWVVGHGATLALPSGEVSLVPLGLSAVFGWLCWAGGRRMLDAIELAHDGPDGRLPRGPLVTAWVTFVCCYSALATAGAAVSGSAQARAPLGGTFLAAAVVAAGGAVLATRPRWRVPARPALIARAAVVALAGWFGSALLGLVLAVVLAWDRIVQVQSALHPGIGGHLVLVGLQLMLAPTALVWAAAWVAGPGFSVGVGSLVTPAATELAPLPALPLLGAVPEPGHPGLGWVGLFVVAAGIAAGYWLRVRRPACRWPVLVVDAVAVAVAASAIGALLALLSSGAIGPGRMAEVGPQWLAVGTAAGLKLLIGTLIGAFAGPVVASGRAGRVLGRAARTGGTWAGGTLAATGRNVRAHARDLGDEVARRVRR